MSERELAPAWRGGSSSNRNRNLIQRCCLNVLIPGPDRIITMLLRDARRIRCGPSVCHRREARAKAPTEALKMRRARRCLRSRARGSEQKKKLHLCSSLHSIFYYFRLGLLYLMYGPQVSFFVSRSLARAFLRSAVLLSPASLHSIPRWRPNQTFKFHHVEFRRTSTALAQHTTYHKSILSFSFFLSSHTHRLVFPLSFQ